MRSLPLRCCHVVLAATVFVAAIAACTGDDPVLQPEEQANDAASPVPSSGMDATTAEAATATDASGDTGNTGDAADAADGSDGNLCKATPTSCLTTAKTCSDNCRVTFNSCKAMCPSDANLMNCLATCKSGIDSCQVPCKGDCATCANANGSCTGNSDCEAQMYRGN